MQHDEHLYSTDRPDVLTHVPPAAEVVLDVGCSRGEFGQRLRHARARRVVWGIEPNTAAASEARGRLDHVTAGFFPQDLPANAPKFDLICFTDVLEHLEDPWSALQACHRHLTEGGQCWHQFRICGTGG